MIVPATRDASRSAGEFRERSMRSRTTALVVLAAALVSACTTTPSNEFVPIGDPRVQHAQRVKGSKCTPGNCRVEVVRNSDWLDRPICPVTVDVEILDIRMAGGPRVGQKVVFSIPQHYPYRFVAPTESGARYPIRIKSGTDPFVDKSARVPGPGKMLELDLKATPSNDLVEYGLLVARDEQPLSYCAEIDPWMVD